VRVLSSLSDGVHIGVSETPEGEFTVETYQTHTQTSETYGTQRQRQCVVETFASASAALARVEELRARAYWVHPWVVAELRRMAAKEEA
jgi:hypothetical protein